MRYPTAISYDISHAISHYAIQHAISYGYRMRYRIRYSIVRYLQDIACYIALRYCDIAMRYFWNYIACDIACDIAYNAILHAIKKLSHLSRIQMLARAEAPPKLCQAAETSGRLGCVIWHDIISKLPTAYGCVLMRMEKGICVSCVLTFWAIAYCELRIWIAYTCVCMRIDLRIAIAYHCVLIAYRLRIYCVSCVLTA